MYDAALSNSTTTTTTARNRKAQAAHSPRLVVASLIGAGVSVTSFLGKLGNVAPDLLVTGHRTV